MGTIIGEGITFDDVLLTQFFPEMSHATNTTTKIRKGIQQKLVHLHLVVDSHPFHSL